MLDLLGDKCHYDWCKCNSCTLSESSCFETNVGKTQSWWKWARKCKVRQADREKLIERWFLRVETCNGKEFSWRRHLSFQQKSQIEAAAEKEHPIPIKLDLYNLPLCVAEWVSSPGRRHRTRPKLSRKKHKSVVKVFFFLFVLLTPMNHHEEELLQLTEDTCHGVWMVLQLSRTCEFDWHIHESDSQAMIIKQLMNSEMCLSCSSETVPGRGCAWRGGGRCVFN